METPILSQTKTYISKSNDILKKLRHSKSSNDNISSNTNPILNQKKNLIKSELKNENPNHLFIAHKINFKNKMNIFFKKGVNEIFNNENFFFQTKYRNLRVQIGNSEKTSSELEPMSNFIIDKKLFIKKKTHNLLTRRKSLSSNQIKPLYSNQILKNKISETNNTNNNLSLLSKYDYKKPSTNNMRYLKRPSIYFNNKEFINDLELKNIFLYFKINQNEKTRNNKNYFYRNNFNSTLNKEINNRINLQEKILKNYKINEIKENSLANRLKKITKKKSRDLLMKQVNDYRYKIEKIINKAKDNKSNENYNRVIQWLSSLRQYDNYNNEKNINIEEKNIYENSINSNTINANINNNLNNNYFNQTISSNREAILDNYINKLHYSFGNNSNLYSDIESYISPLYALILPQNSKNKETIKNNNSFEKNPLPIILGKNLLDYEIELSKYLEGKRKIMIKNNLAEDDIKPLIFTKSKSMEKFHIPGAVTNAFDLHLNK